MNFFKRAIVSIKRRPGKTIILLLLVFILGNIISGAISIQQAVQNTEANLKRNLPAVASLEKDWEAIMSNENITGEWVYPDNLTPEMIKQIGELPYVANYEFSAASSLYSNELERVVHPNPDFEHVDWYRMEVEGLERFILKGVQNPEVLDIEEGIINLISGRTFTEQEVKNFNHVSSVALVSKDFAELNNLTVGSTFVLDNTVYDEFNIEGMYIESEIYTEDNVLARESYELEVIGIFEPTAASNTGEEWEDAQRDVQLANRLYIPNAVAERATTFVVNQYNELDVWDDEDFEITFEDWMEYENIFVLNDPTELDDFATAAKDILPEFWIVSDLSSTFSDIASSMETMQWLATIVLWVAAGATLLILSLLVILFLRDRKHEMGIYLALGEKKIKVVSQIILEVVTVSVVAMTLSLFTGSLLAGNISEKMLKDDLINQQQSDRYETMVVFGGSSETLSWFSSGDMTTEQMIESYNLSLNTSTIIVFYGVGIGTILVSTVAPIMYITRLNPKKVMM